MTLKEILGPALKDKPKGYLGFEASGKTLTFGGIRTLYQSIQEVRKRNGLFIALISETHAQLNFKKNIGENKIGLTNFMKSLSFWGDDCIVVYHSELLSSKSWMDSFLNFMGDMNMNDVKRALSTLGRDDSFIESHPSTVLYPAMQLADIVYLSVDCVFGGIDQRKIHTYYLDNRKRLGLNPVTFYHYEMLGGLKCKDGKMSKSDPMDSIFVEDTLQDIQKKMKKAWFDSEYPKDSTLYHIWLFIEGYKGRNGSDYLQIVNSLTPKQFKEQLSIMTNDFLRGLFKG